MKALARGDLLTSRSPRTADHAKCCSHGPVSASYERECRDSPQGDAVLRCASGRVFESHLVHAGQACSRRAGRRGDSISAGGTVRLIACRDTAFTPLHSPLLSLCSCSARTRRSRQFRSPDDAGRFHACRPLHTVHGMFKLKNGHSLRSRNREGGRGDSPRRHERQNDNSSGDQKMHSESSRTRNPEITFSPTQ